MLSSEPLAVEEEAECATSAQPEAAKRRSTPPVVRYRNRLTRAPLATSEEITPSLRSSFNSLDLDSPIDSIRSSLLESSEEDRTESV